MPRAPFLRSLPDPMPDPSSAPSGIEHHPSSETRFRELFEQAPTSIQILAPDGRTLRVNQAWEDLWEIRAGTPLYDFVLSAEYSLLTDAQLMETGVAGYLQRALDGESVAIPAIYYDVVVLGGSGRARWVTARAHPIKAADGRILEVMLMHEDITERVQAETALREREQRFRSLVMATSQIVWSTTPDGRVLEDSPTWRALTGQTYDEWKEYGWLDAVHPDDREHSPARPGATASPRARSTRRNTACATWTAATAGRRSKACPSTTPMAAVREWIGANKDIHEMVMAQAELAERLGREQRHSALLAKVAQASRSLGSALSSQEIADAPGGRGARHLAGAPGGRLAHRERRPDDQRRVAVRQIRTPTAASRPRPTAAASMRRCASHNRIMRLTQTELEAHPDWRGFGAHAAHHPAMRGWLAVPLVDRKGKNIGLIQASDKFDGDFTEQDEAILVQLASIAANGFENARLYSSLKEQDRRKDEFLAMLAHELRNPLAPIASAAELLNIGTASEERVRRSSEVISRQVKHMTSLVDDLLDISRVTRGLIQLENVVVDIGATIRSAVEQSRPLIESRGHFLAIEQDPQGASVMGDPNRLVQVVANLLNNAAKYTPRGGRILLAVERKGHICAHPRAGQRDRHRPGAVAAGVRPVHPGRTHAGPLPGRARHRPGAGEKCRQPAWGQGDGAQRRARRRAARLRSRCTRFRQPSPR